MARSAMARSAYDYQEIARLRRDRVPAALAEQVAKGWGIDDVMAGGSAVYATAPACKLEVLGPPSEVHTHVRCRCGYQEAVIGGIEGGYLAYVGHRESADYWRAHILAGSPLWAIVNIHGRVRGEIVSLHDTVEDARAAYDARVVEILARPAYMGAQVPSDQIAIRQVSPTSAVGDLLGAAS